MDDEVNSRLAKASADFDQINRNVWNRRGLLVASQIKVYRAHVLTTLLYGCETWNTYQRHIKKLNHCPNRQMDKGMHPPFPQEW